MVPVMSLLYTTLGAFIGRFMDRILFRAFAVLGIGIATYTGLSELMDQVKNQIQARFTDLNSIGYHIFDLLVYMEVDVCLQLIISSWIAVAALTPLRWAVKK